MNKKNPPRATPKTGLNIRRFHTGMQVYLVDYACTPSGDRLSMQVTTDTVLAVDLDKQVVITANHTGCFRQDYRARGPQDPYLYATDPVLPRSTVLFIDETAAQAYAEHTDLLLTVKERTHTLKGLSTQQLRAILDILDGVQSRPIQAETCRTDEELDCVLAHAVAISEQHGCPANSGDCAYQHDVLVDLLQELKTRRQADTERMPGDAHG